MEKKKQKLFTLYFNKPNAVVNLNAGGSAVGPAGVSEIFRLF